MKRLMRANGIGVNELARKSGYSASHISQLRSGKRNPSQDTAQDIDQALGAGGELAALTAEKDGVPGPLGSQRGQQAASELSQALPGPGWATTIGEMTLRAAELWCCGLDKHRALPGIPDAVTSFTLRWLTDPPDDPAWREAGLKEISEHDILRIRGVRARLKDIDNAHGGAVSFPVIAAFLRSNVAPLLVARYDEATGRALLEAAAEIELDAGWSAYDAGDHHLARCYFLQALRMAHAARDRLLGARIVCALSHQALHLGEIALSVDLARAARTGVGQAATSRATAMLAAMEAMTNARAGDAERCKLALDDAGRALAQATADDGDPGWLDFDEGGLLGHTARAFRDLAAADLAEPEEARQFAAQSAELCQTGHGRTRAQRNAILATTFLQTGDVDQAAAVGEQVVADAWNLRSQLVRDDVATLFAGIAPTQSAAVSGFVEQARDLLAAYALSATSSRFSQPGRLQRDVRQAGRLRLRLLRPVPGGDS